MLRKEYSFFEYSFFLYIDELQSKKIIKMKIIYIVLSTLVLFSCSVDNSVDSDDGPYPKDHIINNVYGNIFEDDTLKFKFPDFFDVELIANRVIIEAEINERKEIGEETYVDITDKFSIKINPLDDKEIWVYNLIPNIDKTGFTLFGEYSYFFITLPNSIFDVEYSDKTFAFDVRVRKDN